MPKAERIANTLREQGVALQETFVRQALPLAQLAERVAGVFQHGGRLLLCGSGALAPVADLGAHHFLHRLALERPSLPALSLGHNPALAAALARDGLSRHYFAHQLRTVAAAGDILLLLADATPDPALHEAAATAAALECACVVALPAKAEWGGPPPELFFRLESEAPPRLTELALTFTNLLCELVEAELFGI